ncbi:MAG: DNA pilot protein [Microvirus sp.]|nr:MAG: DNA pilot protein [Microvirus sp.]
MGIGSLIAGEIGGGLLTTAGQLFADQQNRNFSEHMSSTAHQRETKDLIAAGLNPILSATGGHGAPMAQGTAQNPTAELGRSLQDTAKAMATDLPRLENETKMMEANSAKADADRRNTDADTILKLQATGRGDATTNKLLAEIEQTNQATRTSSAQETATRATADKTRQETEVLKAIVPFIKNGTSAINQLVDYARGGGKLGDAAYELTQSAKNALNKYGPAVGAGTPQNMAIYLLTLVKKYAPELINAMPKGDASSYTGGANQYP